MSFETKATRLIYSARFATLTAVNTLRFSSRSLVIIAAIVLLGSCYTPYTPVDPSRPAVETELGPRALEIAMSAQGAPYLWGGNGPERFDCSGLVVWAYRQAHGRTRLFRGVEGYQSDIVMDGLYSTGTVPLDDGDLAPGDVVFITSSSQRITHGGLFIRWIGPDTIEFLNASSYHGAVVVDTIEIDGTLRGQWYVGAGRLVVPTS